MAFCYRILSNITTRSSHQHVVARRGVDVVKPGGMLGVSCFFLGGGGGISVVESGCDCGGGKECVCAVGDLAILSCLYEGYLLL
jgi:hypothetical protein